MDTDVLIVGAGPTGLMLANQLARHGVRPLLIDRHAGPSLQTRALGVQARTLEIYARLGVIEQALAWGKQATGANLWADGRHTARVPLGDAGLTLSPYPYILILGQDDNERILGDHLRTQGAEVQWNTELVGLQQAGDHAEATLRMPDGSTRSVRAAWVAGCDGARSAVRTLSGIGFPGAPYEHVFFVADVQARGAMVPGELNVYFWRDGFHLFFPMRGGDDHWRIVGILPAALRGRDDIGFDAVLPSVRHEAGAQLQVQGCRWFSTYRIHHRAAETLRAGRAFLLGDAAHIHSPVGAQGMNTGLQDAYNLGWKLARVARGQAPESLLDSFEAERLPVAQRLLATTDRAFKVVVSDSPLAALLRTRVLARVAALVMRSSAAQRLAFRAVSQVAIGYRDSPLSQDLRALPAAAPRAGDRFPWLTLQLQADAPAVDLFEQLDDRRFTLIVFGPAAPADTRWQPLAIPATAANDAALRRARIPQPSFFLLRPDGHVAIAGAAFDAVAVSAHWTAHFGT